MKDETSARPRHSISILESASAAARLQAARDFVRQFPPATDILVVGASRQAADDFVRELVTRNRTGATDGGAATPPGTALRATFGLRRFSLLQLAAFLAAPNLATRDLAPASRLGVEALATRAVFDARREAALVYLAPIADRPGFPAALADTVGDLRGAEIDPDSVVTDDACTADVVGLLERYDVLLRTNGIADAPAILRLAAAAVRDGRATTNGVPLVLLDVPVRSAAVYAFASALTASASEVFVTQPLNDPVTAKWLETLQGANVRHVRAGDDGAGALVRLQERLFETANAGGGAAPAQEEGAADVHFFSAPGEDREAVEVARRIVAEGRRGTPFDRIAVLLRAPQTYAGPLETAFRRAGIRAWFARGTRRPDPTGRAFLALIACALERLSARRFAEYLSLGEVPDAPAGDSAAAATRWVPPDDELLREPATYTGEDLEDGDARMPASQIVRPDTDADVVISGSVRTPWRWEELLVEASVVGSRDRWRRRLDGLARELELRLHAAEAEDFDSPRVHAIRRELRNCGHLRDFALPIIERLSRLPERASWGDWLREFEALAPLVLRSPDRVLMVLAELHPMAEVGPVTLTEVHRVLSPRLSDVRQEAAAQRYGAVFVGTPEQARGRVFDVVFVPGLAERVFPQRSREDPLLVDDRRRNIDGRLPRRDDLAQQERLMLRVAVGAASRRVYLSYPSMELAQARARVPSFYALDVERARTGRIPDFELLAERAQREGGARLAWPAPGEPDTAIDDNERDLATLGRLLDLLRRDPAAARGRARFLLALNPHLARALRARWLRAQRQWSAADGLYNAGPEARAALAAHRLRARPYSVSAIQRFATCPYQFLLGAIHRLEPRGEIAWLEQLDPLQRGNMFHRVQAEVVRRLVGRDALRAAIHDRNSAFRMLDEALDAVADQLREQLVPAIDRVWRSEIEAMRTDLRGWLQRLLDAAHEWEPRHAEFGFGFAPEEGRDPASVASPVTLPGGWQLHGFVDLVEQRAGGETLRITDHKTGRARTREDVVVGGGEALQPVLYGMALEIALAQPVEAGRLFYCTLAGSYEERIVPLDERARRSAVEALEIVDRALEIGSLPPAPRERACQYCDFRPVCGPDEERRIGRKDPRPLADLEHLRGLR